MTSSIAPTLLGQISEYITDQIGLYFPKERWPDLARALEVAARECGFQNIESFSTWLLSSSLTKSQIELLARHLTVGETYFFREKSSFEILERQILPALIQSRRASQRYLRIWTAGCCTGEEPYSVAILISMLIPDLKDWNVTILATDINPQFLEIAARGIYRHWSFRTTPASIKERFFKKQADGRFELRPDVRKMVTFAYLNLAEDLYPSYRNNTYAMDIIFCRNVLMYFAPQQAKRVVQNLHRSLGDSGWLIGSPSETSDDLFAAFTRVSFPGAILYRKASARSQAEEVFPDMRAGGGSDTSYPTADVVAPSEPETIEERTTAQPRPTSFAEALKLYEQGHYTEVIDAMIGVGAHQSGAVQELALL
jgi:chemotaxis protein methyltransferase CheR